MLTTIVIIAGLILLAVSIYSIFCNEPTDEPVEPEEPNDYPLLIFPKYPIEATSMESQSSISITDKSNHGWNVEIPSWMTVDSISGTGTKSILVTIKKNSGKKERSGNITITDNTNGDLFIIPVTQKAKSSDETQVVLTISPGQYITHMENNYDLIWDIREGNDDSGNPLFEGQLGYPCQSGSVYNWGDNQWSELIPESEWGTKKIIHYELAVVDYDNNGHAYNVLTGTAEVDIPANPEGIVNLSINLPNFGV